MRQSQLFTKTRKEAPKDEMSKNADLLIRAGFIHKEMAGVYAYLPLGFRVLEKIKGIIREEMNLIGGQEILMTSLQDPKIWERTNRWDDKMVDNWFKTKLATGTELGIANTHEEPITDLLTEFVQSYKDLPLSVYQFQTKFRNELRAKSGIMRAREFLMKDLYSFHRDEEDFRRFYERCAGAYLNIFKRLGLGEKTFRTFAAGGSFTTGHTDEFQTISDAGEDIIYVDYEKRIAVNKEIYTDENLRKFGLNKSKLVEEKSIEVGNIFPLGTKYPEALGLRIRNEDGKETPVIMGSYGIGLGRVMGTVVEALSDEKGIVWPDSISPFRVHVLVLHGNDLDVRNAVEKFYFDCSKSGIEVLLDDRDVSAGSKFADADLIGIPGRVIISQKTLAEGGVEYRTRTNPESKIMSFEAMISFLEKNQDLLNCPI